MRKALDDHPPSTNNENGSHLLPTILRACMSYQKNILVELEKVLRLESSSGPRYCVQKTSEMTIFLIYLGGSRHFVFSQELFISYETVGHETVQSATRRGLVFGKQVIALPFNEHIEFGAFHALQFTTKILSICELSKMYTILFEDEQEK